MFLPKKTNSQLTFFFLKRHALDNEWSGLHMSPLLTAPLKKLCFRIFQKFYSTEKFKDIKPFCDQNNFHLNFSKAMSL